MMISIVAPSSADVDVPRISEFFFIIKIVWLKVQQRSSMDFVHRKGYL